MTRAALNRPMRKLDDPRLWSWRISWIFPPEALIAGSAPATKLAKAVIPKEKNRSAASAQQARAQLGLSDQKVLLFFGFVREYKGLHYLLQAMDELDE